MVLCVCIRACFFTVGSLKKNDRLEALYTYGFSTLFTLCSTMLWLSVRKEKNQVVTLGTWGWSQAQLAAEFHTTQSNMDKLLKKHRITGEVKA